MKFNIEPLKADNFFAWSNDVEVMLKGEDLWTYIKTPLDNALMSRTDCGGLTDDQVREENMARSLHGTVDEHRKKAQEKDLVLAYILTSIDKSCKEMVRKVTCPAEAWAILKATFSAVSESSFDAKLSKLQAVKLQKSETMFAYSKRILDLISELEST